MEQKRLYIIILSIAAFLSLLVAVYNYSNYIFYTSWQRDAANLLSNKNFQDNISQVIAKLKELEQKRFQYRQIFSRFGVITLVFGAFSIYLAISSGLLRISHSKREP